ncbi:5'-nucleotidase C-terminal domain-containing protein [Cohnella cellulosilytica]|uniref:5'-nucleotidase C-terminal domain-containing protein n=1 Tax=Cohnella cellulosilytica TaxID=986710 RepID=A0ABW2F9Z4_9BACL
MNRFKKRLIAGLTALFLLIPVGVSSVQAASVKLQIVHFNDVHSRVEESDTSIGYAKIAALIKQLKEANPNTLVLDAGDTFHGQTVANLVKGESIVQILDILGIDAMTTGNHDYNYGYERLTELADQASFPVLAANVYQADGTRLLEPYTIKTVGDVKVAIFGLATPETLFKTHPNNVKGLTFADPVEEGKKMVEELRDKADVIIALTHLGLDESSKETSRLVAEQVAGIDLIVDGHSHTVLEQGLKAGDTLIAQTGEYGNNLGVVELTLDDSKKVVDRQARLIARPAADDVEADEAITEIINKVKEDQLPVLSEVVGSTKVDLQGEREFVRTSETNLGNLIADAMLAESGADVALTNGGGVRASIPAGDITVGQVITVLPFGNYIQTKRVKGSDLLAALELGVGAYPDSLGGFPQIAGMKFTFDESKPQGQRVQSAVVGGKPLDANATYLLATNDFMAAGGDNYTMFKDYPIENDFASLEEAVIKHIRSLGQLNPQKEGRITAASPSPAPQPQPAPEKSPEPTPVPQPQPQQPQPKPQPSDSPEIYVVAAGDNLTKIAKRYGTTWQTLHKLNKLANPNLIFPGQRIVLP